MEIYKLIEIVSYMEYRTIVSKNGLEIREFLVEDLKLFKNFSPYDDILLTDYNLCFLNQKELLKWKKMILNKKNNFFSIFLSDNLIGYISVKKCSFFDSDYELSISLDAKYASKGYGFLSLQLFLRFYFYNFNKNSIYLNVNSFNKRAIGLYEKIGFKRVGEFLGDFEVQNMNNLKRFLENKEYFEIKKDIIYSKIITMELDKFVYMERWG